MDSERPTGRASARPAARLRSPRTTPAEALPVETRRTVTVLFVDVTGSTPLGERLDPEAIRRIFSRYFGEVAAIVTRHGGTLEKFAGDALVAVFGHPVLHEDDALRAVRAAAEARAALAIVNDELVRDYGLGLNTRTGVNTGEVVTGDNATGSTIATGDMVNVAARLEARAQPGEIVIGAATYRLVRDAVTVEELEPLELKGKSQPVAAYRLVDLAPDAPGLARRLESPLVGRSLELAELLAAFEEAVQESSCRAVTLLGDAGAGKSRLAHELATVVGERAAVLEGRCVPYGEGITYFPLSIMLKPLAGIEDGDTRDAAREKLLALLPGVAEANLIVARLAGAIGLDDVLARPEEIAWAVRRLLESLARERPVLIFLDDLHWAELTFLRLVQHLVEFGGSAPILVVCSSRPDLTEIVPVPDDAAGDADAIVLESLPQTAAGALISNLLGDDVAPEIAARVAEAAEGNPLFIEETARMLLDEGLIALHGTRWEPVGDLAQVVLPPSIEAVLAARLDRLAPARAPGPPACVGDRPHLRLGGGPGADAGGGARHRRRGARRAAAEGGRLHRRAAAQRRGRLPLRPHPRPRRRLSRRAEGDALRAARAVRLVPRGVDRRPRRGVRGDHRLPPRAGVHVPDAARPGHRRDGGAAAPRATSGSPPRASARSSAATCRRRSTSSSGRRTSRQAAPTRRRR